MQKGQSDKDLAKWKEQETQKLRTEIKVLAQKAISLEEKLQCQATTNLKGKRTYKCLVMHATLED